MLRRVLAAALAAGLLAARPAGAASSLAEVDAAARAAGNRKPAAVAIGRQLFARQWPVQILKVRVDGVGGHEVAGLVLSGRKFHSAMDPRAFGSEVADLVRTAFGASNVEEVDVWAIVPLKVGQHAVVAGDKAVPTSRVVYATTVLRGDGPPLEERVSAGPDTFWDPAWRAALQAP